MEVPAILTLETGRPLSLVAGQAMIFFEPIVLALFRLPDYRRFAALIERREALEALIRRDRDRVPSARGWRSARRRRTRRTRTRPPLNEDHADSSPRTSAPSSPPTAAPPPPRRS